MPAARGSGGPGRGSRQGGLGQALALDVIGLATAEQRQRRDVNHAPGDRQILGAELVPFEGRNISRIKYMDERGRVRYMDDPGPGERLRHVPALPRRDDNDEP